MGRKGRNRHGSVHHLEITILRYLADCITPCGPLEHSASMTLFRRYLVVYTLMLWQGGFVFYSAIVVPVGTATLGSAAAQGAITARVVEALHLLGVVSLALLLWDMLAGEDPILSRRLARWIGWLIAAISHGLLLYFHFLLLNFMDPQRRYVVIHPPFYPIHQLYLWTSTIQWIVISVWLFLTIMAWKYVEDRKA